MNRESSLHQITYEFSSQDFYKNPELSLLFPIDWSLSSYQCIACLMRKGKMRVKIQTINLKFHLAEGGQLAWIFHKQFLLNRLGNRDYWLLSKREKDLVRVVSILCEFHKTGTIEPIKEQTIFDGPIGKIMVKYLSYRSSLRLKKHTIEEGQQHLYRFLRYLHTAKVSSVKAINQLHIIQIIKTINPKFSTLMHLTLQSIRGFFKYAHKQNLLDSDLSMLVPKDNFRKQPNLPSIYSAEEVEKLIGSIDRDQLINLPKYL